MAVERIPVDSVVVAAAAPGAQVLMAARTSEVMAAPGVRAVSPEFSLTMPAAAVVVEIAIRPERAESAVEETEAVVEMRHRRRE
jgi:hypothetical protein